MASQQSTVDYILEQIEAAGSVSARKMFGEYGIYCDGRIVARSAEAGLPAPAATPLLRAAGKACQCPTISARLSAAEATSANAGRLAAGPASAESAAARSAKDRIRAMTP